MHSTGVLFVKEVRSAVVTLYARKNRSDELRVISRKFIKANYYSNDMVSGQHEGLWLIT